MWDSLLAEYIEEPKDLEQVIVCQQWIADFNHPASTVNLILQLVNPDVNQTYGLTKGMIVGKRKYFECCPFTVLKVGWQEGKKFYEQTLLLDCDIKELRYKTARTVGNSQQSSLTENQRMLNYM